jgi:hypothetical protein
MKSYKQINHQTCPLNKYISNNLTTSNYTTTSYYAPIKNNSNFWTHKDMNIVQETTISMDYSCDRVKVNQHAPMMDGKWSRNSFSIGFYFPG